jgi:hypothetical protein
MANEVYISLLSDTGKLDLYLTIRQQARDFYRQIVISFQLSENQGQFTFYFDVTAFIVCNT